MAGSAVAVTAIGAIGEGIVLLRVTPEGLLLAAGLGAVGALLVEISSRVFSALPGRSTRRSARAR